MSRVVEAAWRGEDDPSRLDVASVDFGADGGFVATGRQSTETYRAQWDLVVDAGWRTRLLTVDAESTESTSDGGPVWQRHLNLWRHDVGSASKWRAEVGESGEVPAEFGPARVTADDLELLADAVDVDLSGCPLTNTMPAVRLGVRAEGVGERPIVTAWVRLPDLAVIPSSQAYASSAPGLTEIARALDNRVDAVVHYSSATRGVAVDLSLDADGLVLAYPNLASRLDLE